MDPVLPDYDGPNVSGVVPALLGRRPVDWMPDPVRGAGTTVLLVVDGLGWAAIEAYRSRLPNLASMAGGPITTVVPSTTATALTSIATGLPPAVHGVTGYRMRVDDVVLNVLRWTATETDGDRVRTAHWRPEPEDIQRHDPFLGADVPVVTKAEFRASGFTAAHLRGGRFLGWSAVSTLVERCRRLARDNERFVYAYYSELDAVAHGFGLHDGFYEAELIAVDGIIGRLLDALPERAALVVTADHGVVHVPPEGWLQVGPAADLAVAQSGDGRFRYLHARAGAAPELLAACREAHADRAWVMGREQLMDEGWMGHARPGAPAYRRVGDVVLAARDPVGFLDPALPGEAHLLGAHGSLTPDEMYVPLLSSRGRAG